MERKLMFAVLAMVATSATLPAATVTVNPPAGTMTNVAVFGTATLPAMARAVNAGDVRSVMFARVGDLIYAVKAPNGTMVIVR